nr:tRNA 2-thiouridine(34) synthase MnmA [Lachnospiraceae bacterium]
DGHYSDYVRENAGFEIDDSGYFTDPEGNILGKHKGIINYTVGQRKGLGIALGYPAYVSSIDAVTKEVVIGDENSVLKQMIICDRVNYVSIPSLPINERIRVNTKIRYRHNGAPSFVEALDEEHIKIIFEEAVKAPAPGQSAVLYDEEDRVIGGGRIIETK